MIVSITEIARAAGLQDPKHVGSEIHYRCPNHDDNHQSLKINPEKNCYLCGPCGSHGNYWDLVAFLNDLSAEEDKPAITAWLRERNLLNGDSGNGHGPADRRIIKTYPYVDEQGNLLYEVCRFEPKDFRQRRPDGNGGWTWKLAGVRRVLYRLPAIPKTKGIFVTEGEKDVDNLERIGLPATTNAGGAGKWRPEYAKAFGSDQVVVILPDNDEPGRKHANLVAKSLHGKVAAVKIIELPDLLPKGDVSDWLAGRDPATAKVELKQLVAACPPWAPAAEPEQSIPDNGLPWLNSAEGDLAKATREAWAALEAANRPPRMFKRGMPVRLEEDDEGAPILYELNQDRLRHELAISVTYFREKADGTRILMHPPLAIVKDMLAIPNPPLPILDRLVEVPVFASDGSLEIEPGYHVRSRTYFAPSPGFVVPPVPEKPSDDDMARAIVTIQMEMLRDFAFKEDAERAHAVALLLQLFVRDLIDGPTPLYLVEKPTPGTGASLLVDILTYPVMGRPAGLLTEGRDEDEWRKRLTAKLLHGDPVVVIDNLRRRLDSSAVSAAITARIWEDRRLGASESLRIPVKCAFVATGNNPALSAEISRRTIRIRLDANMDRPWLRTGFRHPELRKWVQTHRAEIVWSALVLIRRWISEGCPIPADVCKLGMFESWSEVMAGILHTADIRGFLTNLDEFYDASDAEGAAWRGFVGSWWQKYKDAEVTLADLFPLAEELDLHDGSERSQKTRLGKQIAAARDRRFGDLTIRKGRLLQGLQRWALEEQR